MKRYFAVIILLFALWPAASSRPRQLVEALTRLDSMLAHKEDYRVRSVQFLDSLRRVAARTTPIQSMRANLALATVYTIVDYDSAQAYYDKIAAYYRRVGDDEGVAMTDMLRATSMPSAGQVHGAIQLIDEAEPRVKSIDRKIVGYVSVMVLIHRSIDYYATGNVPEDFRRRLRAAVDSLLPIAHEGTAIQLFAQADDHWLKGDFTMMQAALHDIIAMSEESSRDYSLATYFLGNYYAANGKKEEAAYYYALSTMSDIRAACYTGVALTKLGELLYELGDNDRAHAYFVVAINDIIDTRNRISIIKSSHALRLLKELDDMRENRYLTMCFILGALLVVAVAVAVSWYLRHRRLQARMESLGGVVDRASGLREQLMKGFLRLSWHEMERVDDFNRLAKRKLASGQVEEFYDMLKSGKLIDDRKTVFFDVFDTSFLEIFPDFVDEVNRLLRDDAQLKKPDGNRLTTELRILAFVRTGVDDSSRIARYMGLSVNTVYTYRNRLRGMARNRATFDENIARII